MLTDILKEIAGNSVSALLQADMLFGTVQSIKPFSVLVDERFTLEEDHLVFPSFLERRELHIRHKISPDEEYNRQFVLFPGILEGDAVILLNLGGQYLIVGTVGEYGKKHIIA